MSGIPPPGEGSPGGRRTVMRLDEYALELERRERVERIREFFATLHVLTPRVYVTHLIIAACAVMFALMVLSDFRAITAPTKALLIAWGANNGPLTLGGQSWRLFTCMFLHIGILHFALNMWVLWSIGPLVERVVGNVGFVLLFVASGLCGSLASVAWNPEVTSAGASGGVFGLFGGLLGFLVLGHGSMPPEVVSNYKSSTLTFIGLNILFGFIIPHVDNAAHLGGLAGGCLCGLCLGQPVTLRAADYRWLRNLLVLVLGCGITAGGLVLLPKASVVEGAIREYEAVHDKVIGEYSALVKKVQSRSIDSRSFAEAIEQDIVPPLSAARAKLESVKTVPIKVKPLRDAYLEYARLHEEELKLIVEVQRQPSDEINEALAQKQRAVKSALEEVIRMRE